MGDGSAPTDRENDMFESDDKSWKETGSPNKTPRRIRLAKDREAWEQQPEESDLRFRRFIQYLNLGRSRRMTEYVIALTNDGEDISYGTIRNYASEGQWARRAKAWDIRQEELIAERVRAARQDMVLGHLALADRIDELLIEALRNMEPEMLSPQSIAKLAKVSSDLRVTVLGKAGQSLELTGPSGGPIQTEDVSTLTEEQRDARRKAIVAELARRAGMSIVDSDDDDDDD